MDADGSGAAMEKAARRVAAMLLYPEHLDKVDQYRLRTSRKKAAVEARLKTAIQSQLDDVQQGLTLLRRAQADIKSIETGLQVEEPFEACDGLASHVTQARKLSSDRDYLRETMAQLDRIFTVPETVDELREDLETEGLNLLEVHHRLAGLELCRDQMLRQMNRGGTSQPSVSSSSRRAVEAYFSDVAVLSSQFQQQLFFEILDQQDVLHLAIDNPTKLVTVLRIIEREERADTRAQAVDADRPKRLKKRFFEELEIRIQRKFDDSMYTQNNSVPRFLASFEQFYFQDLKIAKDVLPEKFPPHYDIFQFFLNQYHDRLCGMLQQLQGSKEIDPSEIMRLLNWVPDYNRDMKLKLQVDVSEFSQQLLGCNEEDLRGTYLSVLSDKLKTWCSNLVLTESQVWFELPEEDDEPEYPDTTSDGLYFSDTAAILFQMIDQQVEVAFQPGSSSTFAISLLSQCVVTLKGFQAEYLEALHRVRKQFAGALDRHPFLAEFMMVSVNNSYRARLYIKDLLDKLEDKMLDSEQYQHLRTEYISLSDGFHGISMFANEILVCLVMTDLGELLQQLFTTKWMRSQNAIKRIIATLGDYFDDFDSHLQRGYQELLLQDLGVALVVEYIKGLLQRRYVLKNSDDRESMVSRLNEDAQLVRQVFETYEVEFEGEGVTAPWEAIENIAQVLDAEHTDGHSMVSLSWLHLRSNFSDVTLPHLEALLTIRDDFNTKDARGFIRDLIKRGDAEAADTVVAQGLSVFRSVPVTKTANYSKSDG